MADRVQQSLMINWSPSVGGGRAFHFEYISFRQCGIYTYIDSYMQTSNGGSLRAANRYRTQMCIEIFIEVQYL